MQFKRTLGVRNPVVLNLYTGNFLAPAGDNVLLGWSTYPWAVAALPELDGVSLFFESLPGWHPLAVLFTLLTRVHTCTTVGMTQSMQVATQTTGTMPCTTRVSRACMK